METVALGQSGGADSAVNAARQLAVFHQGDRAAGSVRLTAKEESAWN